MKKRILAALLLAALMVPQSTAFAYEAKEIKREKPVPVEAVKPVKDETGLKTYTLTAAILRAKEVNGDLTSALASLEVYEDAHSRAVDALDGLRPTPGLSPTEQDPANLAALKGVRAAQAQVTNQKYASQLEAQLVEYNVLSTFIDIKKLEQQLPVAESNVLMQQMQADAAVVRYHMGMISANDLDQANAALYKAQAAQKTAEDARAVLYMNLKQMLKESGEIAIDYTPTFTPMELNKNVDLFIDHALESSITLKRVKEGVDLQQYNLDNYVFSGEGVRKSLKTDLENAERSYADTQNAVELLLYNLYSSIRSMENTIKADEATLQQKERSLAAGKVQLELGMISKLQYEGLKLDRDNAAATLQSDISTYILNCAKFQNVDIALSVK